jgi:hypothetical protein
MCVPIKQLGQVMLPRCALRPCAALVPAAAVPNATPVFAASAAALPARLRARHSSRTCHPAGQCCSVVDGDGGVGGDGDGDGGVGGDGDEVRGRMN